MLFRDSRGIDDKTIILLLADMGNLVNVLLIVYKHAFLLQLSGQVARRLVVASYNKAFFQEVAGDGTHAYTACSYEIDSFDIFYIHFAKFITSLAMMSAELGRASFSTFSLSDFSLASSCTVSIASCSKVSGASASFT